MQQISTALSNVRLIMKNDFLEIETIENIHIQIWEEKQSWDDSFRRVY